MSEGGALVRFHDWHHRTGPQANDAPPLRLPRHRAGGGACLDWACHPGVGGRHVIPLHPVAHSGAEVRHRLLTYRIIKEICNAARELARFPAPFISVLTDLLVAGYDSREIHPLAPVWQPAPVEGGFDRQSAHVADTALGLDDARCAWIGLELAAQAQDLHVDAAVEHILVHAGRLQQVLAA